MARLNEAKARELLAGARGRTPAAVARKAKMTRSQLYYWQRRFSKEGVTAETLSLKQENERLKSLLGTLLLEREFNRLKRGHVE